MTDGPWQVRARGSAVALRRSNRGAPGCVVALLALAGPVVLILGAILVVKVVSDWSHLRMRAGVLELLAGIFFGFVAFLAGCGMVLPLLALAAVTVRVDRERGTVSVGKRSLGLAQVRAVAISFAADFHYQELVVDGEPPIRLIGDRDLAVAERSAAQLALALGVPVAEVDADRVV